MATSAATTQFRPQSTEAKRNVRQAVQHQANVPDYYEDYRARLAEIEQTNRGAYQQIAGQQQAAAGAAGVAGQQMAAAAQAGVSDRAAMFGGGGGEAISSEQLQAQMTHNAAQGQRDLGHERGYGADRMAGMARVSAGDQLRAQLLARQGVQDARRDLADVRAQRGGFINDHMQRTESGLRDQQLAAAALELESDQFDSEQSMDYLKTMLGYRQATAERVSDARQRRADRRADARESELDRRADAREGSRDRRAANKRTADTLAARGREAGDDDGDQAVTLKDGRRITVSRTEMADYRKRKSEMDSVIARARSQRGAGATQAEARNRLAKLGYNRRDAVAAVEVAYGGGLSQASRSWLASTFPQGWVPGGYY